MKSLYFIPLILVNIVAIKLDSVKEVFRKDGDVNVALILRNKCNNTATLTENEQSIVNSAIWIAHQLNYSEVLFEHNFGLTVYKTCNENEEYETLFHLFQKRKEEFLLGIITTSKFSLKVRKFADALDLNVKGIVKCSQPLIKASVALLSALKWFDNVVVVAPDENIINQFSKLSKKEWICVDKYILHENYNILNNSTSKHLVVFGDNNFLITLLKSTDLSNAILVPLDNSLLNDLPENNFVISSQQSLQSLIESESYYTISPQIFEIAMPFISYAKSFKHFKNCYEKSCSSIRSTFQTSPDVAEIVNLLKFSTSSINYYIYKSENGSLSEVFLYNIFNDNLTQLTSLDAENYNIACESGFLSCRKNCKNFEMSSSFNIFSEDCKIELRPESWVYAFLSLSLLGILLSIAILIFLLLSICRQNVLDGNPALTVLLLIVVIIMYCSVFPMSLEGNKNMKESLCLARALSITLSFSAAFSLILSRSILLATASKEIGFMSHVPGSVQSFLSLFIFGVQAALSLQVTNNCRKLFKDYSFIYLLSYNIMLLLLLLCLSPLIIKCQRNYREGKYFTLATITVSFFWCFWIPAFAFLGDEYKDFVLCFGVVSTASALLGTIFIPRTYLMTIAAARDKLTSTLPSLAATTSAIDIYRAGTQPVYDCVNVAAINAVTVARAGITTPIQQPDLYSCPNLPEDYDFDERCDSPVNDDKVTRF